MVDNTVDNMVDNTVDNFIIIKYKLKTYIMIKNP